MAGGPRTLLLEGAALLAAAAWILGGCDGDSTGKDLREIEKSYYALRDAILQGDDEAFFAMHSRAARERALADFPGIRASYLSSIPEEKDAFHGLYRITAEEFLGGDPRALVVKMMPWKSGWKEGREMFRIARVKDVRIDHLPIPGGGTERRGILVLEVEAVGSDGRKIPEAALPSVVFVRDPEGWRRRSFFRE